jgi:hypothetical protein
LTPVPFWDDPSRSRAARACACAWPGRAGLPAIKALLERCGIVADELALARLVRVDPRERIVICAVALVGCAEEIVGIGAIDVDTQAQIEPSALIVDGRVTEGLDRLLASALIGRSQALARARAA